MRVPVPNAGRWVRSLRRGGPHHGKPLLFRLLVTGVLFLPVGLVTLSVAMLRSPAFGLAYGRVGMLLGAADTAAAGVLLVQVSEIAVVVIFALIVFHLSVGGKLIRLSREPSPSARHATAA